MKNEICANTNPIKKKLTVYNTEINYYFEGTPFRALLNKIKFNSCSFNDMEIEFWGEGRQGVRRINDDVICQILI